jgi:hypothetical protein
MYLLFTCNLNLRGPQLNHHVRVVATRNGSFHYIDGAFDPGPTHLESVDRTIQCFLKPLGVFPTGMRPKLILGPFSQLTWDPQLQVEINTRGAFPTK